jgi:hypothetical protein
MGLKFKTSATITLIFLALVAIMHAVLVREIAPTLSSAEMYIAENNLSKLVSDTQDLARDLQRRAEEWSHTSNLVDPTTNTVNPMVRSHLERQPFEFDDLLILDPGGRVVFTGHLDGSAPSFSPIALERESAILSIAFTGRELGIREDSRGTSHYCLLPYPRPIIEEREPGNSYSRARCITRNTS